jgi:hypothetical protein
MSARIRHKEATIRLAMEGQDQEGSFLKVKNFSVDPDAPITKTKFCGEKRDDADQDFNGYDIKFEIEELDSKGEDVLDAMDAAQAANLPPPRSVISTLKIYREIGKGTVGHVYHPVTLTCTQSTDAAGGYVGSKWSGFAPNRETIK